MQEEWPIRRSELLPFKYMRSSSEETSYTPSNRNHQPGNTRDINKIIEGGPVSISKDSFLPFVRVNY
jgi:hypothetical protein